MDENRPTPLNETERAQAVAGQKKYALGLWMAMLSSAVGLGGVYFLEWSFESAAVVMGAGWVPFYAICYRVRRCPRCQKTLGTRQSVEFCTGCGVQLTSKPS